MTDFFIYAQRAREMAALRGLPLAVSRDLPGWQAALSWWTDMLHLESPGVRPSSTFPGCGDIHGII